jgi:hypothetical protein
MPRAWHFKHAAGQLLNECRHAAYHSLARRVRRRAPSVRADPVDATVRELQRVGFCVLPEFITRQRCAELVARIEAGMTRYSSFVQVDAANADRRLFGLDAVDEEIRQAAFDPRALGALERYQGTSSYEGFALCAKLTATPGNIGSGQGWHRDSAAFMQTKCMIYLTDVAPDNGPFQYVVGSHRPLDVVRCAGRYGFAVNKHRFGNDEMAELLATEPTRVRELTAPAGTAIVFDSRGLHRGAPIVAGERYAITTYLWFNQPAPQHIRAWTIESQERHGPMSRVT